MIKVPVVKYLGSMRRGFCLALALCLFAPIMLYAAPRSQIFVLHSYSQEYPWTKGQHEGFIQTLAADAQVDLLVSTEYLDTKRRAYDETYASELARHLRLKYADYKPEAIYITDDNALLFARDHLSRNFPGVPIFFSGVNDYSVRSGLDPALFTGVFERQEFTPNIEWLLRMDKDANDLVFVGDGSNTYKAIQSELRTELIPYRLRITFIAEKRLDRVMARLHDLPGKYIFLTTLGGMTDENGQVLPLREIMKSLTLTGRIVISMEDANIMEGVLGGYVTSGQQQGMNAARLLLAYLHGKPIADLPPILKSPNAYIFDDRVLQQHGIDLPENIRSQAVLLHPLPGMYEQHRSLILGMLIALAALLFSVVTASLVIMSRKNRQIANASQQLAASETRLHAILDAEPECVKIIGPDGSLRQMNPAGLAMIESLDSPSQVLNKKVVGLVVPEHRDAFIALTRRVLKGESGTLEFEIVGLKGTRRWLETHAVPLREASGEIVLLGVSRDITERKQAEEKLIESENKFRSIFEQATDGILIADAETKKHIEANKTMCIMLGYTHDEIVGLSIDDIHPKEALPAIRESFEKQLRGEISFAPKVPVLKKDGSVFYADINATRVTLGGRQCLGGIFRDITDKQKLEDQLRQAQKMESIGILAGGIAHDFNNILAAIVGYGHVVLMKMAKDDPQRENIEQMLEAGDRAARLTQSLLLFSRKQISVRKPVDLNEIIRTVDKFLKRVIGEDVECRASLSEKALPILGDTHQLEQLLMNLATNARDAMPTGGIFTIATEQVRLDDAFISIHGYGKLGIYGLITISDTGKGMDAVTQEHIFEPFYTTKEVGKGTGLGLSIAYGIIKQHEGFINVYSEPGQGTSFKIYLPLMPAGVKEEKKLVEERPRGGTETILLAEDDETVRTMTRTVLEDFGYTVIAAVDGRDVVNKFKENRDRIKLLLFDIIMPKKSGKEAYDEIRAMQPDIKILFQSGYAPDLVRQKVLLDDKMAVVFKPVTPMMLLKQVRSVLDEVT